MPILLLKTIRALKISPLACVIQPRLVTSAKHAAPTSLFWEPNRLNESPEMRFEFLCILLGKSTMAFLTDQAWRVLKSWYTGGDPEQGFRFCLEHGLTRV